MPETPVCNTTKPSIAEMLAGTGRLPRCPGCGYNVADNTTFQCPECGQGFCLDDFVAPERPPVLLWFLWYAMCGVFTSAAALILVRELFDSRRGNPVDLMALLVPASIGTLPMAAMIGLRFVVPGWRELGRHFFAKFVILLWPLICPGLWILGLALHFSIVGVD